MMVGKFVLGFSLSMLALPALAQIKQVDFARFPEGTECGASGGAGKVKVRKKRNEIQVSIKGDTTGATFFCVLPDGRKAIAILPELPAGTVADLQTWADGTGQLIMSVKGNLVLQDVPKAIRWSK
ncbi:MAG: hypothetical protein R3D61_01935 [Defluviimonas denitrificans]|jgi:hypothetical protein